MNAGNIEVHIDFAGGQKRVGLLRRNRRDGKETLSFEYHEDWRKDPLAFSLQPALKISDAPYYPDGGLGIFGSIGDSAPDTWGRNLMQRAERRAAKRENRAVRTLLEADYLLGVADITRLGALRFRNEGDPVFQAPIDSGVPSLVRLAELLHVTERLERDEETDDDLRLIFAPGSSLGGARPKASVVDNEGRLAIAKFPKENDLYRIELWEQVALTLADKAKIEVPRHQLVDVAGKQALLSWRFDRDGNTRIPFLSAMSMLGAKDNTPMSYPELADELTRHGSDATNDLKQLYRRVAFNILVSNVDDHLRNHGFLWDGLKGWTLSPVYDLNPVPTDVKQRVLSTRISIDDATCDIGLLESVSDDFSLSLNDGREIIREVSEATSRWREIARACGASSSEVERMESAFEHQDLANALKATTAVPASAGAKRKRRGPRL